ncbi:hypothetical protein AAEU32_03780 [Pseudoalteromonas sp. SSDWG2]|uniref:hypothetical protein n=1 Tax=Pseudoalteromonas sp. SSDWG2 TaxID=3139391 RepID=UPI003BAC7A6F
MRVLFVCLLFAVSSAHVFATNKQHVRIVSEPFPPYFGPSLAHNGWMAHIVRDTFATQDISVEFDFTVWTRALKQAKEEQQNYFKYRRGNRH